MDVGIGEVDGDLEIVVGHRGVQNERTLAVDPQIETVEEAGPAHVEAELAVGHRRKVTPPIRDEERLVVLEDELGQVGGEGRGKDVVVVADRDRVSGMRSAHAERAWPATLW